jgi:uncharacterized protein
MSAVPAPSRLGALWQQRMQSLREYEVVRDGNVFSAGFASSVVFSSEYDQARSRLADLHARYEGVPFNAQFHGREIANDGGSCFALEYRRKLTPPPVDTGRFRQDLMSDLTLVRGIGPAIRKKLNARGFCTLPDLLHHPLFRAGALQALARISGDNTSLLMNFIGSRHAKSHPSVLGTAMLHAPEDFVFVDIETLGLFSRPIILFGVGVIEQEHLVVRQYLVRDVAEECAALVATAGHLAADHAALATFNGRSFDLPYITDRLSYYGLDTPGPIPHYDVLHFSRRRWKDRLPSMRLSALEKEILGVQREDDIPGQMVPEFYEHYLRTGNIGPLVPIVEHNRQDVISLALLFFYLLGESCGGY